MQMPSGRQLRAGRILAGLDQSELARLAKVHVTTIVRLEAFEANQVRGQSGTITAVVNALAKAGVDLGENGSIIPRPKGKGR
jgi:predicted transcriptional regulator